MKDIALRFTRLRLNGFKSFVDPTDLEISSGLTGVVGPNGCGKSNLLEALRWVMGEHRPTAVRGGGMEDMIFAGASSRPARSNAEVTLLLDNSARLAPAGFNDEDTLDITRKIARDTGSAFKVNGKDARARDVQMLFADASTGAQSPALVRQGQIGELINAKPKHRRRILEEAAGISGLYQRRHEAELKLKGAEQNLSRVEDVIGQLASQIKQLSRQTRQASRYRELAAALREAEGMLLLGRWQIAEKALQAAQEALNDSAQKTKLAEHGAREAEALSNQADAAIPEKREEDTIAAAILQRIVVAHEALEEQERQAQSRIRGLHMRIEQLKKDLAREQQLDRDASESLEKLNHEAAELKAAHANYDDEISQAAADFEQARAQLARHEATLAQDTEKAASLRAQHQSAEDAIKTNEAAKASAVQAMIKIEQEQDKTSDTLTQKQAEVSQAQTALTTAQSEAEVAKQALQEAETKLTTARELETELRAKASEASSTVRTLAAEQAAIERLLTRDAPEGAPILEEIQVDAGYETALSAAIGADLEHPLAEQDGIGWNDSAAITAPLPAGITPLAQFVRAPKQLQARLNSIGVIDTPEDAANISLQQGQALVSRQGQFWRWDGLHLDNVDSGAAAARRLEQRNRLAQTSADLQTAKEVETAEQRTHANAKAQLQTSKEAEQSARDTLRKTERKIAEFTKNLSASEQQASRAQSVLEDCKTRLQRHEQDVQKYDAAMEAAWASQAELGDLEVVRAQVERSRAELDHIRQSAMQQRAHHDTLANNGAARAERIRQCGAEIEQWTQRLTNVVGRCNDLAAQQAAAEKKLHDAMQNPERIELQRQKLAHDLGLAKQRKADVGAKLEQAETSARTALLAAREAAQLASQAREFRAGAEVRAEAATQAHIIAHDHITEHMQTSPDELLSHYGVQTDLSNIAAIEAEINELRQKRDSLGAVNLRAEDDAAASQTEYDTLVREKEDLEAAIGTLRKAIATLNSEGRERLLAAFEEVNENFATLFTHLFGGGEAKLVMVDSDDPLDAGLEIMCQPPGKKLSNLSLLSGGEQTLTAMALIFAVFLANPAPICVLDEVDAPLDDANVGRFCDLLDEMTRRTQTRFLIITHHAVTMSRMDRLFGVTMQEQGVSQLVSVDLKKAESLAQ